MDGTYREQFSNKKKVLAKIEVAVSKNCVASVLEFDFANYLF